MLCEVRHTGRADVESNRNAVKVGLGRAVARLSPRKNSPDWNGLVDGSSRIENQVTRLIPSSTSDRALRRPSGPGGRSASLSSRGIRVPAELGNPELDRPGRNDVAHLDTGSQNSAHLWEISQGQIVRKGSLMRGTARRVRVVRPDVEAHPLLALRLQRPIDDRTARA
jgi:hypothetical protein